MIKSLQKTDNLHVMSGIDCRILRQKRKSLAIYIIEGEVVVKSPLKLNDSVIDDFVNKKRDWIIKKLDVYFKKYHRFLQVLELKQFLLNGEVVPHFFVDTKKTAFDGARLLFSQALGNNDNKDKLKKAVKKLYIKIANDYLAKRLAELATEYNFTYTGFSLSNAKTKWGSCDSKKQIRLNWRLVLLPKNLQDYVVLHELCHTYYLNHSQNYWNLLAKYIKNPKGVKRELKEYGLLIKYLD